MPSERTDQADRVPTAEELDFARSQFLARLAEVARKLQCVNKPSSAETVIARAKHAKPNRVPISRRSALPRTRGDRPRRQNKK